MIWNVAFARSILPDLFCGLLVTIEAVACGFLLALVIGLILAILRRSHRRLVSGPAGFLVELIRSTPLLIQLYLVYYALPDFGIILPPMLAGVLALGLHYGSYTSEVYRAGIDGVPRGQWHAARALNFTAWQTYRYVIIPQAIPPVVPALGNYLIAMFKDTPLLSAITVLEVLQRAKNLGNEHFHYLEPLTIVGGMYLVLSLLSGYGVTWLERKLKAR
jgi:polar amino acid transport system permease protein